MWTKVLGLGLVVFLGVSFAVTPVYAGTHFKKVVVVVLENKNYDDSLKQPFMKKLADEGALFQNFFAETHPSQPNYIAMVSGSTMGVTGDSNVNLNGRHLGDLLEAKGLGWKVYAEQYPGGCFLSARSGGYVRKHVPFLSFQNVQSNPARCGRIVDSSAFAEDIQSGTLPEVSLYIPDLNNDGHDTSAAYADHWLQYTFEPLLKNPKFTQDTLLVVTFDESEMFSNNRIFTVFVGDSVVAGTVSSQSTNHYSLLRMIEDEFGLGSLGLNDAKSAPITGVWK